MKELNTPTLHRHTHAYPHTCASKVDTKKIHYGHISETGQKADLFDCWVGPAVFDPLAQIFLVVTRSQFVPGLRHVEVDAAVKQTKHAAA